MQAARNAFRTMDGPDAEEFELPDVDYPMSPTELADLECIALGPDTELSVDDFKVHVKKITGSLTRLALHAYATDLKLSSLLVRFQDNLQRMASTRTLVGKTPAFLDLLPNSVRNMHPSKPIALARHLKEEDEDQRKVREQRDAAWKSMEHLWTSENKTWGKIDDKDKAHICIMMAEHPACWTPDVTSARTVEHISYVRSKFGNNKRSNGTPGKDSGKMERVDLTHDGPSKVHTHPRTRVFF
jgi:hypothetical protein